MLCIALLNMPKGSGTVNAASVVAVSPSVDVAVTSSVWLPGANRLKSTSMGNSPEEQVNV